MSTVKFKQRCKIPKATEWFLKFTFSFSRESTFAATVSYYYCVYQSKNINYAVCWLTRFVVFEIKPWRGWRVAEFSPKSSSANANVYVVRARRTKRTVNSRHAGARGCVKKWRAPPPSSSRRSRRGLKRYGDLGWRDEDDSAERVGRHDRGSRYNEDLVVFFKIYPTRNAGRVREVRRADGDIIVILYSSPFASSSAGHLVSGYTPSLNYVYLATNTNERFKNKKRLNAIHAPSSLPLHSPDMQGSLNYYYTAAAGGVIYIYIRARTFCRVCFTYAARVVCVPARVCVRREKELYGVRREESGRRRKDGNTHTRVNR